MDWTLLLAYMTPIITALGTGVAFLVKIKQAFNNGAEHLKISQDDIKKCCNELLEENDIKQLNQQLIELAQENAALKKQLNDVLTYLTKVKHEQDNDKI